MMASLSERPNEVMPPSHKDETENQIRQIMHSLLDLTNVCNDYFLVFCHLYKNGLISIDFCLESVMYGAFCSSGR